MNDDFRFGCVLFDDPHQRRGGWACIADEKPFLVSGERSSTEELETDVVWLTNLGYDASFAAGFANHARFPRDEYIKFRPVDCGALFKLDGPDQIAAYCAQIFSHVMHYIMDITKFRHVPKRTLCLGLRAAYGAPDNILDKHLVAALDDADRPYTTCERNAVRSDMREVRIFRCPSWQHAKTVLAFPVPADGCEWVHLSGNNIPAPTGYQEWAQSLPPALFRVVITRIAAECNHLLNFGNLSSDNNRAEWITTFDLLHLSTTDSEILVKEAYIPSKTTSLSAYQGLLDALPQRTRISISGDICARNIWQAAPAKLAPPPSASRGRPSYNTAAPFVRALDRGECYIAARILEQHGMEIMGYGTGLIRADVTGCDEKTLLTAARAAKVLPPLLSVNAENDPEPGNLRSDLLALQQVLWGRGMVPEILGYDNRCFQETKNDSAKQANALAAIGRDF